jgi:hypothetical protein
MSRQRWVAARDGVGHLQAATGRTACGSSRTEERWAWPVRSHCRECLVMRRSLIRAAGTRLALVESLSPIRPPAALHGIGRKMPESGAVCRYFASASRFLAAGLKDEGRP